MSADFIKLYPGFFLGTISRETVETRLCFVALISLADEHGVIRVTKDALARYVNIDLDTASEAIDRLSAPDLDSTSPDCEGRRIVPWGDGANTYRIVNYRLYYDRSRAEERKEYQRDWVNNKRAERRQVSTGVADVDKVDPESESESDNESESVARTRARARTTAEAVPVERGFGIEHADPLVCAFLEAVSAVPKFSRWGCPNVAKIEQMVAKLRQIAPSDESVLMELPPWTTYNDDSTMSRKGGQKNAILAFQNWCANKAGRWALERSRAAKTKQESPDALVRRLMNAPARSQH